MTNPQHIYVIYDSVVKEFADELCLAWQEDEDKIILGKFAIEGSEQNKTLKTVEEICRWLLSEGADHKCKLVAVGGGVVCDLVGLVAGIYKRGVAHDNVPTTLLAQVDAAIGGKNGVNLDGVKNILGIVSLPGAVYIYSEPLRSLRPSDWRSGSAEMLKTFLIGDPKRYQQALGIFKKLYDANYSAEAIEENLAQITALIKAAGSFKSSLVKSDLYDNGKRRVLNLGHTYGHAIEWWQNTKEGAGALKLRNAEPFTHGEAVSIGIIQSAKLSEQEGFAKPGLAEELKADFKSCGLPTELPCSCEELSPALVNDKKMDDGFVDFVFMKSKGKTLVLPRGLNEITVK